MGNLDHPRSDLSLVCSSLQGNGDSRFQEDGKDKSISEDAASSGVNRNNIWEKETQSWGLSTPINQSLRSGTLQTEAGSG